MAAEPLNPKLPFLGTSVDFTNPFTAAMTILALIVGFVIFHMADAIGSQGAQWVNQTLASLTGAEVADGTGDSSPEVV
jgi:hypothetical protein